MQIYHIPTVVASSEYTGKSVILGKKNFLKVSGFEVILHESICHFLNDRNQPVIFYLSINWSVENPTMM